MRWRLPWRRRTARAWTEEKDLERALRDASAFLNETPRLLYWSDGHRPSSFVRPDIAAADRDRVVEALRSGVVVFAYLGFASCRICQTPLGTCDMLTHGMLYPQKAEHYLVEHSVWTPECDELLHRIRARG